MKAAVTEGNPTMNAGSAAALPSFIISYRMQLCCCAMQAQHLLHADIPFCK